MAGLASVQIIVHGLVTGIGFRAFTRAQAKSLGVSGYVLNLPDGRTVEVDAEGEEGKLEELISRLRKGPPLSLVEKVEVRWSEHRGIYKDFMIKY